MVAEHNCAYESRQKQSHRAMVMSFAQDVDGAVLYLEDRSAAFTRHLIEAGIDHGRLVPINDDRKVPETSANIERLTNVPCACENILKALSKRTDHSDMTHKTHLHSPCVSTGFSSNSFLGPLARPDDPLCRLRLVHPTT